MVRASWWHADQQPARLACSTLPSSSITASLTWLSLSIFGPPPAGDFHSKRRYRLVPSLAAWTLTGMLPALPLMGFGSSFSPEAIFLPTSASSSSWQETQLSPFFSPRAPLWSPPFVIHSMGVTPG